MCKIKLLQSMKSIKFVFLLSIAFFLGCDKDGGSGSSDEMFRLTVIAEEGGTVSTEGGVFQSGTEVMVSAIPDEGYQFINWSGINSTDADLTIKVESDTTLTAFFIQGDPVEFTNNSDLPLFIVNTSVSIENEPKVPGSLKIYRSGQLIEQHNLGIEFRGSTSFRLSDKKSFGFETWDEGNNDIDASILGFPEEEDWILMGHVHNQEENILFDPTLIRHFVGYELYRAMGNYSSRCEMVELFVNGEYLGVYVFMEKLKRDNERIDISRLTPDENDEENITGGYILKIDKTSGGDVAPDESLSYFENNWADDATYNANISFRSNYGVDQSTLAFAPFDSPYHPNQYLETYFLYEYPKAEEISTQQKEYIANYIDEFETALINDDFSTNVRTYTDYIDINSFVDYFLLNELVGNIDAYRISTYLSKDKGEKLKMGPVWDLNLGYGDARVPGDDWIINYNTYNPQDPWLVPFWWPRFLEDPQFVDVLKQRWTELRSNELSTSNVTNLVQSTSTYLQNNDAIMRNYDRWTGIDVDYSNSINDMVNYLTNRLNWMDSEIGGM